MDPLTIRTIAIFGRERELVITEAHASVQQGEQIQRVDTYTIEDEDTHDLMYACMIVVLTPLHECKLLQEDGTELIEGHRVNYSNEYIAMINQAYRDEGKSLRLEKVEVEH